MSATDTLFSDLAREAAQDTYGRWADAQTVASDLPGVKYLRLYTPRGRVEVYGSEGAGVVAAAIIGRRVVMIHATDEMADTYSAACG